MKQRGLRGRLQRQSTLFWWLADGPCQGTLGRPALSDSPADNPTLLSTYQPTPSLCHPRFNALSLKRSPPPFRSFFTFIFSLLPSTFPFLPVYLLKKEKSDAALIPNFLRKPHLTNGRAYQFLFKLSFGKLRDLLLLERLFL